MFGIDSWEDAAGLGLNVATGGGYGMAKTAWDATVGGGVADAIYGAEHTYDPYAVDPSVGQYGDSPDYYKNRLGQLEEQRADAQQWGQQARNLQGISARSYQDVLAGKAPSLAAMQQRQGVQMAAMNGANLAASARGGGGTQLLAMQQAQRQQAMTAQDAVMQSAMLRAKEQDVARQGLAGVGAQMRQSDMARENAYLGASQSMTQDANQQKLGLAQVQSGNYNNSQGLSAASTQRREGAKAETTQSVINAAGGALAKMG